MGDFRLVIREIEIAGRLHAAATALRSLLGSESSRQNKELNQAHRGRGYRYQQTDTGGKIDIETANPKALDAVHEFLRFQIAEHKTGDPTEVANDTQHQ